MRAKKARKKVLSFVLALCMLVGILPTAGFAAQDTSIDSTATNVNTVQSYSAQMRKANTKTDYSEGGFTWDTERKKDSWRYFNGVMMDAFLMEGDTAYADAFYNSNINDDGTIQNYITGELDSVPTARGLFDLLNSSHKENYKKAIQYVYTQLEDQVSYDNCGGNYLHKQDTSGNPTSGWSTWNIGLDGLYMAQPFLMECANAIDNGTLTLTDKDGAPVSSADIYKAVYDRFAWVADNMYDDTTGLYNHGWNVSDNKGNGHFWGRGIGWYAMALVDTISMMPATYQTQMQPYLTKLFDGMLQYQDADTGMWYNVVNRKTDLSKNILETSVSSMMAYSLMKAYIKGYVTDEKYGQAGLAAFNGVVANKVTGSEGSYAVKDTYLKSGVGTSDSYYTANGYTVDEAKGTGALIMASTVAKDTAEKLAGTDTEQKTVSDETTSVSVSAAGVTGISVDNKSGDETVKTVLADKLDSFTAYDITLKGYTQGNEATVTMPAPAGADKVYYVAEDSTLEEITGATFGDDTVTFTTTHFSTYAVGKAKAADSGDSQDSVSASGTLPGSTSYVLDTNGVDDGATYLIVSANSGTAYALRNNNGSPASQSVTISGTAATITENEDTSTWTFSQSSNGWSVKNGETYLRLGSDILGDSPRELTVTESGNGAYRITYNNRDLRYNNGSWSRSDKGSTYNVYLFKQTTPPGAPVTLTVTPNSASLKPNETANLTASVLVNDAAADSYEITWSTSDNGVATVTNGVVTAVADGNATITATLTGANGLAPTETVKVEIPITVTSKPVASETLTGNDAVTTRKGEEPDFSNIKLNVTYDDNSTAEITTENGLVISGYDINEIGVHYATITYQGKEYGTVKVTVEGNPYEGLGEATDYPEYPADGAVRIDKTATGQNFNSTGVVQVELDTAGISVKKGVDVVLVVDVSNSMAWSVENSGNGTDAERRPSEGQTTKLRNAMNAATEFSNILLGDNNNTDSDNTVSLVTFGGYDADNTKSKQDFIDSVQTVFVGEKSADEAQAVFDTLEFSGTGNTYTLTIGNTTGNNRGNTNYDYAFWETNRAIGTLQNQTADYANSGRQTYVVFMTDGAPSNYQKKYYKDNTTFAYVPGTTTLYSNLDGVSGTADKERWYNHISTTKNEYAKTVYDQVEGNFYAIGFDLAHGGFNNYTWTETELTDVVANMVEGQKIPVTAASDATTLTNFYKSLATQIKYAGTNARVTDTVDSNFTLQTTSFGTDTQTTSPIKVTAYDLYTKAETTDSSLIGTRKGTSTTLETVKFNETGTEAYSDKLSGNIMTTGTDGSVTIEAQYFTYTKDADGVEKFVWNIGDITDKEVALSYYAYLKGSMDGTCAEGVYYTNERATLEYVDINGKYAAKEFPKPNVNWGGAITTIEYYLVNEDGKPVNNNEMVIPFANRIKVGDATTRTFNWNESLTVNGSGYVPAGYDMYNTEARYTVKANSDGSGSLAISDTKTIANSTEVTTKRVDTDTGNYASTAVAFGVLSKGTPVEKNPLKADQIVIDYGKTIQANITSNEAAGAEYKVLGFVQYSADTNVKLTQFTNGTPVFNGDYGQFTIVDGKVQYKPKKMLSAVEKIFAIIQVSPAGGGESYRMLNELDIIPATSVYYETDFADGVFTTTDGTNNRWSTKQDTAYKADEVQNDGTIGVNQTYGFDSTYTDDAFYSNGTSLMVEGEKSDKVVTTTASFDFTGTGFDLISSTGANQGLIQVKIFANGATEPTKTVKVLNKSESELELYQIPVVSVNDLAYGTYHVTVEVYEKIDTYTGNMESLNRGGEFYFDAVRVFSPIDVSGENLTGDAAVAQAAYTSDGEANASVTEIRQKIIDKKTYDDGSGAVKNAVVFVDRNADGVEVADYTTIGPNNEVYLSYDQGIAFKLTSTEVPASIDIGAKSADGNAVTLNASLYSMDNSYSATISEDITSCTAQNYDLMAEAEVTTSEILSGGGAYVVIFNDGDGVLSLTDFKVAYGNKTGTASISVTPEAVKAAAKVPVADEPNYDILSASFDTETCKLRNNATMTVVTTEDVKSLQVTDYKNRKVSADITSETENGQKTWKVSIKMTNAGNRTYTVTGYGASGEAGASASATINVTRK